MNRVVGYRVLGRTGVKIAPLALGTDNILNPTPEDEASKMILRALDAGINLIDTSNSKVIAVAKPLLPPKLTIRLATVQMIGETRDFT
jgi:predicted aldo/keto reductase-like oxidoreductase